MHARPRSAFGPSGLAVLAALIAAAPAGAQTITPVGTPGTFDVATWNVRFFGRTDQGPSNEPLQFKNVLAVLRQAQVDVWGLEEVTDVATFQRLTDSLAQNGYLTALGPNVSSNPTFDQREAFVYNPAAITLSGPPAPILSGSSFGGRPPFEMRGTVIVGDTAVAIRIIVFHAKAGATQSDYNTRVNGASALKGYIDPLVAAGEHVILLGDFNDELGDSILGGTQVSPYIGFTTDPDYLFTTLPLDQGNIPTYCGSSTACTSGSTLDHIVLTAALQDDYAAGESNRYAMLLDAFDAFGGEYVNTTSDHLPVWARLSLAGSSTPVEPGAPRRAVALAPPAPNPAAGATALVYTLDRPADVRLEVYDVLGRRVAMLAEGARPAGAHTAALDVSALAPGFYLVRLSADGEVATQRLTRR